MHLSEAERALRARERLLAMVSHDLRAPLGTIVVSASNIRRRAARDGTDVFGDEADRIVALVDRMEVFRCKRCGAQGDRPEGGGYLDITRFD